MLVLRERVEPADVCVPALVGDEAEGVRDEDGIVEAFGAADWPEMVQELGRLVNGTLALGHGAAASTQNCTVQRDGTAQAIDMAAASSDE